MTSKQRSILTAIITFVSENKYSPSVRDLCDIVGINSVSVVHDCLKQLKNRGYITWEKEKTRTLKVLIDKF